MNDSQPLEYDLFLPQQSDEVQSEGGQCKSPIMYRIPFASPIQTHSPLLISSDQSRIQSPTMPIIDFSSLFAPVTASVTPSTPTSVTPSVTTTTTSNTPDQEISKPEIQPNTFRNGGLYKTLTDAIIPPPQMKRQPLGLKRKSVMSPIMKSPPGLFETLEQYESCFDFNHSLQQQQSLLLQQQLQSLQLPQQTFHSVKAIPKKSKTYSQHQKENKVQKSVLKCPKCQKSFSRPDALRRHQMNSRNKYMGYCKSKPGRMSQKEIGILETVMKEGTFFVTGHDVQEVYMTEEK